MKYLALLINILINTSSYAGESNRDCETSLRHNGYIKYSNQYANNFKVFYKGSSNFLWVGDSWFSNTEKRELPFCESAKSIGKIERVVLMSSTLLEVFNELNDTDKIVGIGEKKFIFDQAGLLKNAKDLGTHPRPETIISLNRMSFLPIAHQF